MRPLYDDGASSATAATRDYVLEVGDAGGRAPVLNVFGGKITTHRRLAEAALEKLAAVVPGDAGRLDRRGAVAGRRLRLGRRGGAGGRLADATFRSSTPDWAARLVRLYGTEARTMLGGAGSAADLGEDFGATLTEREVRWLLEREWARTADDILWRRTKLGLRLGPDRGCAARRLSARVGKPDLCRGVAECGGRAELKRSRRGRQRATRGGGAFSP